MFSPLFTILRLVEPSSYFDTWLRKEQSFRKSLMHFFTPVWFRGLVICHEGSGFNGICYNQHPEVSVCCHLLFSDTVSREEG